MVNYICVYCKKYFKKKSYYDAHINIKKNCKLLFDEKIITFKNFSKERLISEYFNASAAIIANKNNIIFDQKSYKNILQNYKNLHYYKKFKKKSLRCEKCNIYFSRIDNLNRHLNNSCKEEKNKNKIIQNITNIKTNIINNNTNNITINLIPFDSVRYENLPTNLRKNLLETPGLSIQKLILYEHFNKNKSNQLNILYCNRRDSKMLIYDESELSNNGWSTRNKDEICEIILNKAVYAIEDVINDNDENNNNLQIKDYKIDAITRLIKDVDNEKKFRKEIKENIYDICYDNKNIVKNNKNKCISI
jgi:hypothetical protein